MQIRNFALAFWITANVSFSVFNYFPSDRHYYLDGKLTLISIEPSLGKGPQNLAITSNNGWLLCANMPGQNVAVFRIDPKTGKINPAGEPVAMPSPS